ncbi:prephenate dehydratase [Streptococcus sp. DD12]|uniref:prephenate dehydratase n=1 Tax=Streptococcus sp. DD12 TaxID=1777880 RepID=UPI00079415AA|nr:prephenate dehydratase [Streptococcus sp. DD12]KXT77026.1 Prephenate dehydratase [Streptococcus sp. DD12]
MKVAYLGPVGSFTHNVAVSAFPQAELVPMATITEVMKAYEVGQVVYAIVPVENSIEGSVHESLDYLFHQGELPVVAEVVQPIKQQLLAVRQRESFETIYSHPQAIAQAKKYVKAHYPEAKLVPTASTAYAARYVAEHPEAAIAAIAPEEAARAYDLTIVARDIQEIDENFTRFWVLGAKTPLLPLKAGERKMSLAFTLPDNLPGALYKALSVFAWRGIDLTKIESRPLKTNLGEYFFIVDCLVDGSDLPRYALEELQAIGIYYQLLGTYTVYAL